MTTWRQILIGLLAAGAAGCGGGASPAPAPAAPPVQAQAAPAAAPPAAAPAAPAVDAQHKETKWIGKIPYDVFFDQPLTIAADATVIGGGPVASVAAATPASAMLRPSAAPAESPSAPSASAAPGGAPNWGELLPMAMLVEEVKALRTRLTGNLATVATFNKSAPAISQDGAILAALTAVAAMHPEDVSWKPKAKFIRDLAFEVSSSANGTGREPFNKTKEPFDKAMTLLDGGKPPEGAAKDVPLADEIYLADMMKRIEATFNNLKSNVNTEAKLKENPAATERELRMLATLGTIMSDASYSSAEEEKYQGFTKRFIGGALDGLQALKTANFQGFQAAINQIQTSCSECHQQYRGSNSGF